MDESRNIGLNAKDLSTEFNTQTIVGICLHFWRHFLVILTSRAKPESPTKNAVIFCLDHITHYLQQLGSMAKDPVLSIVCLKIRNVSMVSQHNLTTVKKLTVSPCDLVSQRINHIDPKVIIDFLISLTKECVKAAKLKMNRPSSETQRADQYLTSMLEMIPMVRTLFRKLSLYIGSDQEGKFVSSFMTVEVKHVPLTTSPSEIEGLAHVYTIGLGNYPVIASNKGKELERS